MKSLFKNFQTLIIIGLVIVIFLLRECKGESKGTPIEPITIVKIETKYDTIVETVKTYIPEYRTKVKYKTVHDTIEIHDTIPIDTTSTNIDSLNSTYTPISNPLEEISKKPVTIIPQTLPEQELQIQNIQFNIDIPIIDSNPLIEIETTQSVEEIDPVFAALDEAQDEELLVFNEESIEIGGTEFDPTTDNQPEVSYPNPSVLEDLQPDEIPVDVDYKQINIEI